MSAAWELAVRMAGRLPTPVQGLDDSRLRERGVRLLLKRDDLIDPVIPGNKWRKLEHNLLAAQAQGCKTLLTFGGAYSNHVRAVPEGGSNVLAVRGCAQLPAEITTEFDVICCACGTGGTLAGIASGLRSGRRALGFSVLKGGRFLEDDVAALQRQAFGATSDNWSINHEFHFGGFAKRTGELDQFIADFQRRHGLRLDWVYVAKMLYGVFALAERGDIRPGTTVVAVVTGPAEDSATP